ncbi:ribonuclease H-like domain-containing protein [Tanacetum coccineum]
MEGGYDWSFLAIEGITNFALMAYTSQGSSSSDSETSKDIAEKPKTIRPSALIIEDWDTDNDNEMKGIKMEFSVARTPQQNGVAERKNRTLIRAARTMLADSLLPTTFWSK